MPNKFWAPTGFAVLAFASIPLQTAAAQSKPNHAANWGPMFRSQVSRCWSKPYVAGQNMAGIEAVFRIKLTQDGRLAEEPSLEKPAESGFLRAYQQSALRAINACQPYKLPIEYYDEWKLFEPVFIEPQAVS
ncbi:cell envelope integrity protein TolA [Bradyrhizobium jicamae]|uniref:cell envelope integrity protein TolA n=1 Tax=Bradyrhizobium jicamae TaxID=280332 RepID=UPI001BAB5BEF|nr:cell envelope integrity protein TolA [Bradyrhizobium jicamae]MBR0755990.1 cell envelope integrity protein TolA [Bradyrhizobium jicamae]